MQSDCGAGGDCRRPSLHRSTWYRSCARRCLTAGDRDAPNPPATLPAGTASEAADRPQPPASGWELGALFVDSTLEDVAEQATILLALVAESLQIGATCLARFDDGTWQIAQFHDRAGMGLRVGAPLPSVPSMGKAWLMGAYPP